MNATHLDSAVCGGLPIESVRIETPLDEQPDLSWLGEYSDTPGKGAIDRREQEQWNNREYRYFNPANTEDAGADEQDYERMESYNRGEWCMLGVVAHATVSWPIGNGSRRLQDIQSGGLWGVESDGGDYIDEVKQEQLEDLADTLGVFGLKVTAAELAAMVKD